MAGETFFVTVCCARRGMNQLAQPPAFEVMVSALEHYVQSGRWWAKLFLVMPDHLHAFLSFPRQEQMERVVRDWKRFVAKHAGVVWQPGFFDHRLRTPGSYREKENYVRMNPVRAGLARDAADWPYVWDFSGQNVEG